MSARTEVVLWCLVEKKDTRDALLWMADEIPALRPLLDASVEFHGELLAYLVFEGDFMRWFRIEAQRDPKAGDVARFLGCIETLLSDPGYGSDARDLIRIGFSENLLSEHDFVESVWSLLGDSTRDDIEVTIAESNKLGQLRSEFVTCKCDALSEIAGTAAVFAQEHLVWIDEFDARQLGIWLCPITRCYWLVDSRPAGRERPRMTRFKDEGDARAAAAT